MQIRPMEEKDRTTLRLLYLHTRQESWPWFRQQPLSVDDFDAATRDECIWVADDKGELAGFAALWRPDNFLHHLFVAPSWQGRGVGHALLTHVQAQFTTTGALKCLAENQHALAFYMRHGWEKIQRDTGPEGEYWLMHWPLPE